MMRIIDELAGSRDRALEIVARAGRSIVRGHASPDGAKWLSPSDEKAFLALVTGFAAEPNWVFLVDEVTVDESLLEDAAHAAEPDDLDAIEAVKVARTHLGHVAALNCHLIHRSELRHAVIALSADWYGALPIGEAGLADDSSPFGRGAGEESEERLPTTEIKRLARIVAEDAIFQNSGAAMMQRRAATEAVLDGASVAVHSLDVFAISYAAGKLWDFEIRPSQNAALKPRAVELVQQGKSKAKIAAELGIPVKRLSEIV